MFDDFLSSALITGSAVGILSFTSYIVAGVIVSVGSGLIVPAGLLAGVVFAVGGLVRGRV